MLSRRSCFGIAAAFLLLLSPLAYGGDPNDIVKVEEDWELTVSDPDENALVPQICNAYSPIQDDDIFYGNDRFCMAFPQMTWQHGGKLEFGEDGTLTLNGDTGISAAVKTQLEIIKGEPRIIPIFSAVSGNGNNANYTIIKFVGIRVMEVKLTGKMNKKRVIVQPAPVTTPWGITDTTTSNTYSSNIYSPVRIIH